jgi:hypothetical protein
MGMLKVEVSGIGEHLRLAKYDEVRIRVEPQEAAERIVCAE